MLLCRKQDDASADTLWDAAIADAAVSSQSSASSVEDTAKDAVSIPKLLEVQHLLACPLPGAHFRLAYLLLGSLLQLACLSCPCNFPVKLLQYSSRQVLFWTLKPFR